ncbi:MAG: PepSY-associated TM helix domain-containing protein [Steroidobacteraceae bacterium]
MSSARTFVRRIHLWLGLSLGLLLALLGLTGSLLVFYVEIDALLNPTARVESEAPAPGWDSPVWDAALATARATEGPGDWSFEVTNQPGSIPARFYPHGHTGGHHAERQMMWFSPDGREVLRSDAWGDYAMSWIYELHMHLLSGETGGLIVGWGGLATLLILLTGVLSWWPRGGFGNALSFKRRAVPLRRLRDLHKHFGVWSFLLLILVVSTGGLLALPNVKATVFAALVAMPDEVPSPRATSPSVPAAPLTQVLAAAHRALPAAHLAFIDVPGDAQSPIRLRVKVPGDLHDRFPGSYVFIDPRTAQVLAVHDVARGNSGTRLAAWIRPIHDGSIGGLATRLLAVVLGLVPLALAITGFLYWRRRSARRAAVPHLHSVLEGNSVR